jgi:hypothetical protein
MSQSFRLDFPIPVPLDSVLYLFKKQKILEIIDAMVAFSLVRNKPVVIKAVLSFISFSDQH